MVEIAAFRGLRYDQAVAGPPLATSAPAYEDVAPVAYATHRTVNPYTVLELIAPGESGYQAAGDTLERWLRTGVLRREDEPVLYRYEQHELRGGTPAVQRGVLAAARLEPLGGAVLPHERVDPDRLRDRRRRLEAVPVDLSPVFALTAHPVPDLQAVLDRRPQAPPVAALTDELGTDHRIWILDDPADHRTLAAALRDVPVMIADGHHRYAAALAAGASHTLMYIVDPFRHGPRVRAIHRLVTPVTADALARLDADFSAEAHTGDLADLARRVERASGATFGLRLADGTQQLLAPRDEQALRARLPSERSSAWRSLDAALFHHGLLPALGEHVEVGYRVGLAAAADELAARPDGALFLLRAADLETVLGLAGAGELLPPKSTSFAPKPRTGLVLREVNG